MTTIERSIKKKRKELIQKIKQIRLIAITVQKAIMKKLYFLYRNYVEVV